MSERAFPVENPRVTEQRGMTLRDYFAAHALAGLGTWFPHSGGTITSEEIRRQRAVYAYKQADAMLKARGE